MIQKDSENLPGFITGKCNFNKINYADVVLTSNSEWNWIIRQDLLRKASVNICDSCPSFTATYRIVHCMPKVIWKKKKTTLINKNTDCLHW